MERVHHQLESSLPELKDLQNKGIFSPQEIKLIIKRRTDYEIQLVRRQPRKKDFLEYIEYEMALEKLRKKRLERLKNPLAHSISSHSLVQHQFSLFERATRKFKSDIRLWVQYIATAQREGANTVVSRALAKALKLHPTNTLFYTLAAQHELDQGSPSAARNILQRGIRLNAENVGIWDAYVKMELGWVEMLRRRWERLGIKVDGSSKEPLDKTPNLMGDVGSLEATGNGGESESEAARKLILQGAIVKEVIEDAMKALPSLSTFHTLQTTLRSYPTPLAPSLNPFLYATLNGLITAFPANGRAEARVIYAKRHLESKTGNLAGAELADGLQQTNNELLQVIRTLEETTAVEKSSSKKNGDELEGMYEAYARFVTSQWDPLRDDNLKLYLLSSLHNLCSRIIKENMEGGHALLSAHIHLLLSPSLPTTPHYTSEKILKLTRKYTIQSTSCDLWLARLQAETQLSQQGGGNEDTLETLKSQARKACIPTAEKDDGSKSLEKLWTFGWDKYSFDNRESLLKETLSLPVTRQSIKLREVIFIGLISDLYSGSPTSKRFSVVPRLLKSYFPTPEVYKHAFELEAPLSSSSSESDSKKSRNLVELIFQQWRDGSDNRSFQNRSSFREDATFAWCTYLLGLGGIHVKEAITSVNNLLAGMEPEEKSRIELKWKKVLDGGIEGEEDVPRHVGEDSEMNGSESDGADNDEDEDIEFVVVG